MNRKDRRILWTAFLSGFKRGLGASYEGVSVWFILFFFVISLMICIEAGNGCMKTLHENTPFEPGTSKRFE